MTTFRLWLAGAVLVSACAAAPAPAPNDPCLREADFKELLAFVTRAIDTVAAVNGVAPGETSLVEATCWRRTYERRGKRFMVFCNPEHPRTTVRLATIPANADRLPACWEHAQADVRALRMSEADHLLAYHRQELAWEYASAVTGPAKWLSCPADDPGYVESLDSMLHEMVHELRQGACLFDPSAQARSCFSFGAELPRRSYAKLDRFPTTVAAQAEALATAQKLYLTDLDEAPELLFDELNAYTMSMQVWTTLLKQRGRAALFEGERRSAMFAPLFALYTTRYLTRLRDEKPKIFAAEFGSATGNRALVTRLLDRAADRYAVWLATLKEANAAPKEAEANLWSMHLVQRKALGI